jgi:hypothetical protein
MERFMLQQSTGWRPRQCHTSCHGAPATVDYTHTAAAAAAAAAVGKQWNVSCCSKVLAGGHVNATPAAAVHLQRWITQQQQQMQQLENTATYPATAWCSVWLLGHTINALPSQQA